MHKEQTVLLVGCQLSARSILLAALNRAGFVAGCIEFSEDITRDEVPDCLVLYLTAENIGEAADFLSQSSLSETRRLAIVDPSDVRARRLVADIDVDEVLFKPIRMRDFIARLELLFERDARDLGRKKQRLDEIDFAQKLEELSDIYFDGRIVLNGHGTEAQIYFERGLIVGAKIGKKVQISALSAFWRLFPVSCSVEQDVKTPDWVSASAVNMDVNQFVGMIVKNGAYFQEAFGGERHLEVVYRIHGVTYDYALPGLPRQVRRIVQLFDGIRTLETLLNYLNIDEAILLRIVRRLIDENILVPCTPQENQEVALAEWIGQDINESDHFEAEHEAYEHNDDSLSMDAPSRSAVFYALSGVQPGPEDLEEHSGGTTENLSQNEGAEESEHFSGHKDDAQDVLKFDRQFIESRFDRFGDPIVVAETTIMPAHFFTEEELNDEVIHELEVENTLLDVAVDDSEVTSVDGIEVIQRKISESPDQNPDPGQTENRDSDDKNLDDKDGDNAEESDDDADTEKSEDEDDVEDDDEDDVEDDDEDEDDEDDEDDDDDDEWTDEDEAANRRQLAWGIAEYQKRHGEELSPEEWKRRQIERLRSEPNPRDEQTKRWLTIAIVIVFILTVIVVIIRTSESRESQNLQGGSGSDVVRQK